MVPLCFVVSKDGTADVASVKPVMAVLSAPVTAVLTAVEAAMVSSSSDDDSSSLLLSSSLLESSWKALSTILQAVYTP